MPESKSLKGFSALWKKAKSWPRQGWSFLMERYRTWEPKAKEWIAKNKKQLDAAYALRWNILTGLFIALITIIASCYISTWAAIGFLFASIGIFLLKRKRRGSAVMLIIIAIASFTIGARNIVKDWYAGEVVRVPQRTHHVAKTEPHVVIPKPSATNLPPQSSTPPAFAPRPCTTQDEMTEMDDSGIEKPGAPARPNGKIPDGPPHTPPCTPLPKPRDTSPAPWPPPDSLPVAKTKQPTSIMGAIFEGLSGSNSVEAQSMKEPDLPGHCRNFEESSNPGFQYGDFWMVIEKCHREGTQVRFAGIIRYGGTSRKLLVFHRFTVSDSNGQKYRVEGGRFGSGDGSKDFGRGYSYQWFEHDMPVNFSFVVGGIDPKDTAIKINLIMKSNQSHEDAFTFNNLMEAK